MHVASTPGLRHNNCSRKLKELTQKEEFLSEHTQKKINDGCLLLNLLNAYKKFTKLRV